MLPSMLHIDSDFVSDFNHLRINTALSCIEY